MIKWDKYQIFRTWLQSPNNSLITPATFFLRTVLSAVLLDTHTLMHARTRTHTCAHTPQQTNKDEKKSIFIFWNMSGGHLKCTAHLFYFQSG